LVAVKKKNQGKGRARNHHPTFEARGRENLRGFSLNGKRKRERESKPGATITLDKPIKGAARKKKGSSGGGGVLTKKQHWQGKVSGSRESMILTGAPEKRS